VLDWRAGFRLSLYKNEGSNPSGTANVEVVLHGEKKVPADNLKNTDGMRVRIPSTRYITAKAVKSAINDTLL